MGPSPGLPGAVLGAAPSVRRWARGAGGGQERGVESVSIAGGAAFEDDFGTVAESSLLGVFVTLLGGTIGFFLYIGHNDILFPTPVPYRDLYAQWRAPSPALTRVSDALNAVRLFGGLKHALFAVRGALRGALRGTQGGSGAGVAVPVEDARENVAAIVATAAQHDARVLLVNEGLNPDPVPMRPYGVMLRQVAADTGSAYLDAAEALRATGDPELFLDDCHLSVEGHTKLAGWVKGVLEGEGWLR